MKDNYFTQLPTSSVTDKLSYRQAQLPNYKRKKLLLFAVSFFIMNILTFTTNIYSQSLPVYIDERGDTITYQWPIPLESLCIKNEIIIRFKENALHLNELCQQLQQYPSEGSGILNPTNNIKEQFMSRKFPVQQLIADPTLLAAIQSYGGDTLTRITAADPCHDTLSITRYGDTVKVENYLWMKLHLNNDTSIVNACIDLMVFYRQFLVLAEPNYCGRFNRVPSDNYYASKQFGLHSNFTNTERAWDFQTGNYSVKVGVIDDGIDYENTDLGIIVPYSNNLKVPDGWYYEGNNYYIRATSDHGTAVAGIIGGLTNCTEGNAPDLGIAGIAGGWRENPNDSWSEENVGCPLYGFKIDTENETWDTKVEYIIAAIYDAASDYGSLENENQIKSGFGVHVLNCSWGFDDDFKYLVNLRCAVNYAYEQGVSFVASRGNSKTTQDYWYPANFANMWVTSVGGHTSSIPPRKADSYSFGKGMDILAPCKYDLTYTTQFNGGYNDFDGTSAAAPYVSGAIALLRSENIDFPFELNNNTPEPQDYENMLKAGAEDLIYEEYQTEPNAYEGYDNATGWGQLKVDKVFEMLHNQGYRLKHITVDNVSYDAFSGDLSEFTFYNEAGYDLSKYHLDDVNKLVPGNEYKARMRDVTATYTLEQGWIQNEITPLFVWGRHGNRKKGKEKNFHGGLSQATLNFMTPYTEITSGEKGLPPSIPGLYHNNSTIVHLKTYQFEVYKDDGITKITNLPKDDELAMHFTVYGVNTTSVEENLQNNPQSIFIYPNPSQEQIHIKFNSINACSPILKIVNSFGFPIKEKHFGYVSTGINKITLDVSNLPSGTYFIELKCGNTIKSDKFVINR